MLKCLIVSVIECESVGVKSATAIESYVVGMLECWRIDV